MQCVLGLAWRDYVIGMVVAVLVFGGGMAAADTICVPDDYVTIQEALVAAEDGDEICVAPGTYNEAIDFLGKAVRLYSTDGPEVTVIDATELNSSVVKCVSGEGPDTVLRGFTITGGIGSDVAGLRKGGGMYNDGSSPTVIGCTFVGNVASYAGGGMYNHDYDASPTVTDCVFIANTQEGEGGAGGGMVNWFSTPVVTRCLFVENTSADIGGGMFNRFSDAVVTDCAFIANEGGFGGAMASQESSPTVTNCTFTDNSSFGHGGAIYNSNRSPTVTNCTFTGNSADHEGGAIYNWQSSPTVKGCTFTENTAATGGGLWNRDNDPTVIGCTFVGNAASYAGGAMYNLIDSSPTVINCTFLSNTAPNGRAIACYGASTPCYVALANCILWNGGEETWNGDISTIVITHSDVHGGYEGVGNINADPMCGEDGRLEVGSPCIDAADNEAVPEGITEDLDGNPRFVDDPDTEDTGNGTPPIVDMGAYEFQVDLCPADLDGSGTVDGADLVVVLSNWGPCVGCPHDLDGDGLVGFTDLVFILSTWGPCPE